VPPPAEVDSFQLVEDLYEEEEEDDSLPFYGGVLPWLVPVGCNVYPTGRTFVQYVWLRVDSLGEGIERADVRHIGRRTYADDEVISNTGWGSILEVPLRSSDWAYDWTCWLLENGLAPGQAFLLRLQYSSYQIDLRWGLGRGLGRGLGHGHRRSRGVG
jgi:hypothetical protein